MEQEQGSQQHHPCCQATVAQKVHSVSGAYDEQLTTEFIRVQRSSNINYRTTACNIKKCRKQKLRRTLHDLAA